MMQATPESDGQKTHPRDWWALFVIVLCYTFYNVDKSLIAILMEPIKAEFDLNDSQMGLLSGLAVAVPFALACIPIGMLGDRLNRRNLLAVLVAGWSGVTALTSLATSTLALFASRVGIGTFEAGFSAISLSSLADRFPRSLRSTAMGLFNLGAALGLFVGMAMGGYVEARFGWRTAFLIAGVPGLVLAALLWLTTSEPPRGGFDAPPAETKKSPPPLLSVVNFLVRDKALRNIIIGMIWGAAMLSVFAIWTPSLLRRTYELGAAEAGLRSGIIIGIGAALGATTGGILADRLGRKGLVHRLLVPIGGPIASVIVGGSALLGNWSLAVATAMLGLAAVFGQFYIAPTYAMVATLAGPERRAVSLSIVLLLINIISYPLGASIVGKLSDLLAASQGTNALRHAYLLAFLMFVPASLHFVRAHRLLSRQVENPPEPADRQDQQPSLSDR